MTCLGTHNPDNRISTFIGYEDARRYFDSFFNEIIKYDLHIIYDTELYIGMMCDGTKNGLGLFVELNNAQHISSLHIGEWRNDKQVGTGVQCSYIRVNGLGHYDYLYGISLVVEQSEVIKIQKVETDCTISSTTFQGFWESWPYVYRYDFSLCRPDITDNIKAILLKYK
ncbi:MAG: hypothetical protein SNI49_07560 [Rikenellaceae bacterium]